MYVWQVRNRMLVHTKDVTRDLQNIPVFTNIRWCTALINHILVVVVENCIGKPLRYQCIGKQHMERQKYH